MSRIAYIGGFGSGKKSAEKVGDALGRYYEDVAPFTLAEYVQSPEKVLRAAKGATLMSHSAGALTLSKAESIEAYLLNPPLPRHIGGLVLRSLVKTGYMFMPGLGLRSMQDLRAARAFSTDSGIEMIAHPVSNFSQLPAISRYDAVNAAINAKGRGMATNLIWTNHDLYFSPSDIDQAKASANGIPVTILEGQHDEVLLRPEAFLDQVFNPKK
jgi:hypothetical protein